MPGADITALYFDAPLADGLAKIEELRLETNLRTWLMKAAPEDAFAFKCLLLEDKPRRVRKNIAKVMRDHPYHLRDAGERDVVQLRARW